ncbi:hypothetical protein GS597_01280 [Synechococcales cyanobacterium C]|uniref:Uncharacterized protein n=2 Tax=Petrachloros TaxID=2918834 RepID=A0A8K1ZW42_9CYAN|nr:hypothetical protein [Petrachloros mirabilis ULC683]
MIISSTRQVSLLLPNGVAKQTFAALEAPWVLRPAFYPWREYYEIILTNWVTALHWVYKLKLNPQHRIPGDRQLVRHMKPMGVWLTATLNLCESVHTWSDFLGVDTINYPNAFQWFQLVGQEFKTEELRLRHKTQGVESLRKDLSILKDQRNPYPIRGRCHSRALVEAALKLAMSGTAPKFERDRWLGKRNAPPGQEGFIHAYAAMLASSKKAGSGSVFIQDGQLLIRKGRGRDVLHIPPFLSKKNTRTLKTIRRNSSGA